MRATSRALAAALVALVALVATGTGAAQEPPPPNLLVFLADDLGAGELGCYGHPEHATPRLDRLAAEGTRFETFWATPVCTPSRVLLLTGQYPHRTGYYNFLGRVHAPRADSPLHDVGRRTTFADVLRAAGYATACAGKWQLPGPVEELVHDCGFDAYRVWTWKHPLPAGAEHDGAWQAEGVPSRYRHPGVIEDGALLDTGPDDWGPDLYADFLVRFLRENRDRPTLAYFPMALVHGPWEPTPVPGRPGEFGAPGLAANVAALDRVVGRVLDAVDDLGLRERTLVVFTADNGTERAGKNTATALGVRVPLIVRWPGRVPAGRVSAALGELGDLFPTLVAAAGAAVPDAHALDGVSQLEVWRGRAPRARDAILSYLGDRVLARDERWVLEGDGRLFDARGEPDPRRFVEVLEDDDEARDARVRLERVRAALPGPGTVPGLRR